MWNNTLDVRWMGQSLEHFPYLFWKKLKWLVGRRINEYFNLSILPYGSVGKASKYPEVACSVVIKEVNRHRGLPMKDGCWIMHPEQPKWTKDSWSNAYLPRPLISSAAFQILKILSKLSKVFSEAADSSWVTCSLSSAVWNMSFWYPISFPYPVFLLCQAVFQMGICPCSQNLSSTISSAYTLLSFPASQRWDKSVLTLHLEIIPETIELRPA